MWESISLERVVILAEIDGRFFMHIDVQWGGEGEGTHYYAWNCKLTCYGLYSLSHIEPFILYSSDSTTLRWHANNS